LKATFFQFLTTNILISCSTPSSHRNFGLPTLLAPSYLVLNIFLRVLSMFICTKCPAHASLLTCATPYPPKIQGTLDKFYKRNKGEVPAAPCSISLISLSKEATYLYPHSHSEV
jgi:hypothetical protein